jgi:hypothetical protein
LSRTIDRWRQFEARRRRLTHNLAILASTTVRADTGARIGVEQQLRQPNVRLADLVSEGSVQLDVDSDAGGHDLSTAETIIKFEGYVRR